MATNTRQPKWNIYEAAILLDAYLEGDKNARVAVEVMATKEKVITIKDIIKRANSLSGIISVYMDGDIKSEELPYLTDLQNVLQETTANIAA